MKTNALLSNYNNKRQNLPKATINTTNTSNPELYSKQITTSTSKPLQSNDDVNKCFVEINKRYGDNLTKYWEKRTNQPYKNILYDQDYNKTISHGDDLIVHKYSEADKVRSEQIEKYKESMEKHNNELRVIYSTSKEAEHLKQFEYNHKYKYRITSSVTTDQQDLKKNRILYYKKEQQKVEKDKEDKEKLLMSIMQDGIFNEDELKEFGAIN
jgi:hypothetical protein